MADFDAQYREGFDNVYHGSTIVSKTLQDKKKKDDLMKKVREQTALLKKKETRKRI